MARPRRHLPRVEPSNVPALGEWRTIDDEPDALVAQFATAARWAAHGADAPLPERHGDAGTYIDDLDAWLESLHPGRRQFAWWSLATSAADARRA